MHFPKQMKIKTQIVILASLLIACLAALMIIRYKKSNEEERIYIMGPPWLLYSDERLIEEFSEPALNGESDRVVVGGVEMSRISANQVLYEHFFLSNGNYSKAKPYLEKAASLGDPTAIEILKDPNSYYREFRRRGLGEILPSDFKLK